MKPRLVHCLPEIRTKSLEANVFCFHVCTRTATHNPDLGALQKTPLEGICETID